MSVVQTGERFFNGIIDKAATTGTKQSLVSNMPVMESYGRRFFNSVTDFFGNKEGAKKRYPGKKFETQKTLDDQIKPYEEALGRVNKQLENYKKDKTGLQIKDKDGNFNLVTDTKEQEKYNQLLTAQKNLQDNIKFNKEKGAVAYDPSKMSGLERFGSMFLNDEGKYSGARIGGAIAGSYMAANIVGHGSLGIPFLSTASWNR